MFGWVYLAVSMIPPLESRLLTTQGLSYLDSKIPERSPAIVVQFDSGSNVNASTPQTVNQTLTATVKGLNFIASSTQGNVVRLWSSSGRLLGGPNGTTENFLKIGHCVVALVFAFVGGRLSRSLFRPAANEQYAVNEGASDRASQAAGDSRGGEASK
jgi:hypothetical protein